MGDSIRFPPTLSNSSMKMTHGALAFASPSNIQRRDVGGILPQPWNDLERPAALLKRFLMRLAPIPTNISSNSDPEA